MKVLVNGALQDPPRELLLLIRAIVQDDMPGVKRQLALGADPNAMTAALDQRRTPLHRAVDCKREAIAIELLQAGARQLPDESGHLPWRCAIARGLVGVLPAMAAAGLDVNDFAPSPTKGTCTSPLIHAIRCEKPAVVRALLRLGADPLRPIPISLRDESRYSDPRQHPDRWKWIDAVTVAARRGEVDCLRAIVEISGVDVRGYTPEGGGTLLHQAAAGAQADMVAYLAGEGVEVNELDAYGKLPAEIVSLEYRNAVLTLRTLNAFGARGIQSLPVRNETPVDSVILAGSIDLAHQAIERGALVASDATQVADWARRCTKSGARELGAFFQSVAARLMAEQALQDISAGSRGLLPKWRETREKSRKM